MQNFVRGVRCVSVISMMSIRFSCKYKSNSVLCCSSPFAFHRRMDKEPAVSRLRSICSVHGLCHHRDLLKEAEKGLDEGV